MLLNFVLFENAFSLFSFFDYELYFFYGLFSLYVLDTFSLFLFSFYTYLLLYLYKKNKNYCLSKNNPHFQPINLRTANTKELPFVTIQLPIYNEYYVVDRLLKNIAQIDWPREKLEIQILNDSTDETSTKIHKAIKLYRKKGLSFIHIQRIQREGYKAGALKAGLKQAKGQIIAIFDADFTPPRDFLSRTVPYLMKKNIGMVQTRWGHLNANDSFLTKGQSIGIDGHFVLEQGGRNAHDLWINFNGTAGIWKRDCILEAGNWQGDTLTEDIDISYRAELAGWKFQYLLDIICPAEIPSTVAGYRSQQFRWCKGSIQTAKKMIQRIWRSHFPWKIKLEATLRLIKYSIHPLMFINMLLTLPLLLQSESHNISIMSLPIGTLLTVTAFLCLGSLSSIIFYIYAQKEIYKDWRKRIFFFPALMFIGSGICISNTKAYIEALFQKKESPFLRTPKLGAQTKDSKKENKLETKSRYQQKSFEPILLIEFLGGLYCALTVYYSLKLNYFIFTILMSIYSCGFFYLSIKGIQQNSYKKKNDSLCKN